MMLKAKMKLIDNQLWFVCICGHKLSKAVPNGVAKGIYTKCSNCKRIVELEKSIDKE